MVNIELKQYMDRTGYTITDIHTATGISRSTLTQLYQKKQKAISFNVLCKLSNFFYVPVGDLFNDFDEDKNKLIIGRPNTVYILDGERLTKYEENILLGIIEVIRKNRKENNE